jgi:hypothetical protein
LMHAAAANLAIASALARADEAAAAASADSQVFEQGGPEGSRSEE